MQEFQYKSGEVIFEEGDESLDAYYLSEGSVEISIGVGPAQRVLSVIKPGEIFGEMAMVTDQPRTATATARGTGIARLIRFDESFFQQEILNNPEQVRSFIGVLVERLRDTDSLLRAELARSLPAARPSRPGLLDDADEQLASLFESEKTTGIRPKISKEPAARPRVRITSSDRKTGRNSKAIDCAVSTFPFRIGRASVHDSGLFFSQSDLAIEDRQPFQVSRAHCDLTAEGNEFVVKDRGSRLGTLVNGVRIGAKSGLFAAKLKDGRNELVLGSDDSPHQLVVTISFT